jgi:pimeloyl-ACP methyl ester carboxylesterase
MTKKIYSLLVGIDTYHPQSVPFVPSLRGCVNDINAIEAYLLERVANNKTSEFELAKPLKLANEKATRKAIIDGFNNYLIQANNEDVVLFYYSGHGAKEPTVKEFWQQEPDRYHKTLVCYDSRTPNSRDLADKELSYLISKVALNNPHIVVIGDCCYSGTGSKELPESSRRAPEETRCRPWDSFVFAGELSGDRGSSENISIPQGKHILLSACKDNQEAKEYQTETGEYRGRFSHFLLHSLQQDNGNLSYQDLIGNINALMSGKINSQSPQVEAVLSKELQEQPFLGGALPQCPPYFSLSYDNNENSWAIDGGVLRGIPPSSESEQTILAIFAPSNDREELRNLDEAFGEASVTRVLPNLSLIKMEVGGEILNEGFSYDAAIVSLPIKQLKVRIKGEKEGVKLAVAQLQAAFGNGQPSLYVAPAAPEEIADYYLEAKNGQYWIKLVLESDRPQVPPIPKNPQEAGYTEQQARLAIQRLEHIARWHNTLELKSPAVSRIKSNDLKLEIVKVAADGSKTAKSAAEIALEYDRHYDTWEAPRFFLRLTNQSARTLYCNVLNLSQSYAVALPFFTEKSSLILEPGQTIEGNYLLASLPDELWERGLTEMQDRLKLIVSTEDFDASLLEQEAIAAIASTRDIPPSESDPRFHSSFDRLLGRHQHRELGTSSRGRANDWLTKELVLTIIRPQAALLVSSHRNVSLAHGVEVLAHPTLQAKVSLTTAAETARSIGVTLPSVLRELPGAMEPMRFSRHGRGINGELSALELFDVEDYKAVTPEAPLKVRLDAELQSREYLLAVGFDGEFFLPLGRLAGTGGDTEISLERLPKPTESDRNSNGSIRIFFQKVIRQELALPVESYPVLAVATADAEGNVTYEKNPGIVAGKVAAAQKILLYVRGILGDAKTMAANGQRLMLEIDGEKKPLGDVCDLVLTFDYESINTTIEENARLLAEKLKAAGLAPNHQKQLAIVAHSLGGLICRWFIEKEGGQQVVGCLVMAGTPNAGTPWKTMGDWALATLGFALNQASSVSWPAPMVAKLLESMGRKELAFEQMQPNSDLLRELGNHFGSPVLYTIIAGDRSLVPGAVEPAVLERLMERLLGETVDGAFCRQANDLAVTVASVKAIEPEEGAYLAILDNIACDHLTYFTSEAGLQAVAKGLQGTPPQEVEVEEVEETVPPPVKKKKKWLIAGALLLVAVAIGGFIAWKVYQQQQQERPQGAVSSDVS